MQFRIFENLHIRLHSTGLLLANPPKPPCLGQLVQENKLPSTVDPSPLLWWHSISTPQTKHIPKMLCCHCSCKPPLLPAQLSSTLLRLHPHGWPLLLCIVLSVFLLPLELYQLLWVATSSNPVACGLCRRIFYGSSTLPQLLLDLANAVPGHFLACTKTHMRYSACAWLSYQLVHPSRTHICQEMIQNTPWLHLRCGQDNRCYLCLPPPKACL